ncbi:MAG: hypothetical protein ACOC56_01930 [Atribacterota bacterium]
MDEQTNEQIILFYKKRIEPFMAIFIAALLITGLVLLWKDNQLKEEIKENCGYETKNYVCYCEKDIVDEARGRINLSKINSGLEENKNVKLDK